MLFNSIEFAFFLPIVFFLYWFVFNKYLKVQNVFLLIVSYIFYGWWDWRFLFLIIFSSFVDYLIGLKLAGASSAIRRKQLLSLSIAVNLGFLGFFKYFNFFAESFVEAFTLFGTELDIARLNIILPVGISFYTFQTLSYSIDIYRRRLKPTSDWIAFFSFVSFFPQLVAGPIERASNLLPQFYEKRKFTYHEGVDGMRQILFGLFKKIVIADNCAVFANNIFNNYGDYSGSTLLIGALFFAFQIYGDFSGYSDIAIGTARLFGFDLKKNFAFPYFSRDIAEFWRRWHISLSTWFRDYVYIPLGGSRGGLWMKVRNTFIIFIVSGFWHGANWTFIAWGALNALYFLPLLLTNRNRVHTDIVAQHKYLPSIRELLQMGGTFFITLLAWIFFRSNTISDAFLYIQKIFTIALFSKPEIFPLKILLLIIILLMVEWIQRDKEHVLQFDVTTPRWVRWSSYYMIVVSIYFLGNFRQNVEFIYFQF